MNVIGNTQLWRPLFPHRFMPEILVGIRESWERMKSPSRTELEPRITRHLRRELLHDPAIKRLPLRVERELPLDDPDTGEERGRIDLGFLHGPHPECYLAFECKRLNVPFPSGKKSLAPEYVGTNGARCFLSGKYSTGHEHGGMLGYVMDGDLPGAIQAVSHAVEANREQLLMRRQGSLQSSSIRPDDAQARETVHFVEERKLTLHHLFLPVLES